MSDEVMAALTEVFREVFLRPELTLRPEHTAADIAGWDSFRQIEIVLATQARFGVTFTTREVDSLRDVGDLAALVRRKLGR